MLIKTCHRVLYFARKTKNNIISKPEGLQKIKFSQQQLSNMGPLTSSKPTKITQAFRQKYLQKMNQQQEQDYSGVIQRPNRIKKTKQQRQKQLYNKQMPKPSQKDQRIKPQEMSLDQLTSVRLDPQFLPVYYLKQAQKIFHKYGQTRLRQIAGNFSKLMSLRYRQQKLNFQAYPQLGFNRLQGKLPVQKQVQQIYLIGQQKIYKQKQHQSKDIRKVDQDPFNPQMNYTQNIAVSYLLNRAPRTFAVAVRLMTQIKYKYPDFKPRSFLDFGSGLSAGSCAFSDIFQNVGQTYSVQPSGKMRKLSKYLTQNTPIKYYQSLGQMSTSVRQVDIVYAGYVLNQIKPDLIQVYLQALYTKTKNQGFLIFSQYGTPFGSRIIHQVRKWAIQKGMVIAAPCPHALKCPLSTQKSWCHFDQPSGMYPKNVFGKLPIDHAIKYQKFSYIILQKKQQTSNNIQKNLFKNQPNITKQWDRVLFPIMKKGGHLIVDLCTKQGRFQRRIAAKSHGPQYKIMKKLRWGDYWRFGKRIPNRYRKQRKTGKRLW